MLIVGLGNPGKKYEKTYHNMGYRCVTELAKKLGITLDVSECNAVTGSTYINGERIVLALPTTFMNASGDAVTLLMGKYKVKLDELMVVYDDIDISVGSRRVRRRGSAGTHNGMRNIVSKIGEDFMRLRIGTGKPEEIPLLDFVLMNVRKEDKPFIDSAIKTAVDCLSEFVKDKDFEKLMRNYNSVK